MNINNPIQELLNPASGTSTFDDVVKRLLNGYASTIKVSDVTHKDYLNLVHRAIGGLYPKQYEFLTNIRESLQHPSALISVSTARQVGTSTAVAYAMFYELLTNPHQTILIVEPNKQMAAHQFRMFRELCGVMQTNHNINHQFKYNVNQNTITTPMNGRVKFAHASNSDSVRGYTFQKIVFSELSIGNNSHFDTVQHVLPVAISIQSDIIFINTGGHSPFMTRDMMNRAIKIDRDWSDNPNHDLQYFDDMRSVVANDTLFNREMNL